MKKYKKIICMLLSILLLLNNININFASEESGTSAEGDHASEGKWDKMFPPVVDLLGIRITYFDISGAMQWEEDVYYKFINEKGESLQKVTQDKSEEETNVLYPITVKTSDLKNYKEVEKIKWLPKITINNQCNYTYTQNRKLSFTEWGSEKDYIKNFLTAIGHGDEYGKNPGQLLYIDTETKLSESFFVEPLCVYFKGSDMKFQTKNIGGKMKNTTTIIEGAKGFVGTYNEVQKWTDAEMAWGGIKPEIRQKIRGMNKWSLYLEPEGTNAGIQAVKALLGITSTRYGTGLVTGYSFGEIATLSEIEIAGDDSATHRRAEDIIESDRMELFDDEISYILVCFNKFTIRKDQSLSIDI